MVSDKVHTVRIGPGRQWQNATNKSFNGRPRDECLNVEWFRTRRAARIAVGAWRRYRNAVRPHGSSSYLTPSEFSQQHAVKTLVLKHVIS